MTRGEREEKLTSTTDARQAKRLQAVVLDDHEPPASWSPELIEPSSWLRRKLGDNENSHKAYELYLDALDELPDDAISIECLREESESRGIRRRESRRAAGL